MSIALPNYQYIFFLPMKTGSTSVNVLLERYFKNELLYIEKDNYFDAPCIYQSYHATRHHCILPEKFQHYTKVCLVRNPYNREISRFKYINSCPINYLLGNENLLNLRGLSFEDYIKFLDSRLSITEELTNYNNYHYVTPIKNEDCIFIHLENIEYELKQLPLFKDIDFILENNKPFIDLIYRHDITCEWTDELKDIFYNTMQKDFINFNYEK